MTEPIDDAGFLADVSAEAPCGPDLEAEGDAEFMNFMATIEGQLPAAYFSFDRKSIDFAAALAGGGKLLARSHDARLLVLLAKLAILNRDLDRFAHWLAVLARLLADHWDDAHPRGEDGDFIARISQLSTLDDGPVVVLPLQYAPLAETQRDGVLTFRAQMAAHGDANLREGETLPNAATIEKILLNADMARLAQTLRSLLLLKTSIAQIRTILIERVGFEQALNFEALSPLVDRMASFIQAAVALRDPSVAAPAAQADRTTPSSDAGPPAPAQEFASLADVDAALGAALAYFETMEPSSAAVLLIGQARRLLGKNLYEVMKLLAPAHADAARIFVGADAAFMVPVNSILASSDSAEPPEKLKAPAAVSRAAALALIDGVAAHMRRAEPSSPAPYLLDRAKALASRDFLSLLKDLLPEEALSLLKGGS
ncbi:MAG: type VI secretion system ImpA family N-terminal domain-containing protein [Roseiarcus sp.]|jgi:type VI secretion system protein ImpA